MGRFEDLEVWKESMNLSKKIYYCLKDSKDWFLRDQLNRAILSVPSNIAEGQERDSKKAFVRFLHIAKASCAEIRTQIYFAADVGIIDLDKKEELINDTKKISAMLVNLIKAIEKTIHWKLITDNG